MPEYFKHTLTLQVYITTDVLKQWLALSGDNGVDRPLDRSSDAACNLDAATSPVQLSPEQLPAQVHKEGVAVHCCHGQTTGVADQQGNASHGMQVADGDGMHRLRLFSLNDYMGMSAHPAVRQAAAEAAAACGSGQLYSTPLTELQRRCFGVSAAVTGFQDPDRHPCVQAPAPQPWWEATPRLMRTSRWPLQT